MVDAVRVFPPGFQVTNSSGTPQSGAIIRFFAAGTSNTRAVYSDLGLSTSLGVTVTTNSAGRPAASSGAGAEVIVYTGTTPYKVTAETSAGVSLWSFDNVIGALDTSSFLTGSVIAETPVLTKTSDYTILVADQGSVINANPTGSTFTLTLPSAVTAGDGWRIHIRHTGTANSVNIATVSAQTINGASAWTLDGQYQAIQLVSDAANWHIDGDAVGSAGITPYNLDTSAVPLGAGMLNGTILESQAANATTYTLKTLAGATPSATDPVFFVFASSSGGYTVRKVTSALSFTVSSGSTLGAVSATPFNTYVTAFDTGSAAVLGVIQCKSTYDIYPMEGYGIASSTAEGGAGGADTYGTHYTAAAQSSKPFIVIAKCEYSSGLSVAGTWNALAGSVILYNRGIKLAGEVMQRKSAALTSVVSLASATFGDTGLAATLSLRASPNVIIGRVHVGCTGHSAGNYVNLRVVRDSTALDIGDAASSRIRVGAFPFPTGATDSQGASLGFRDAPGDTSSHSYKLQFATPSGTGYINQTSTDTDSASFSRSASTIFVEEIVA
jgi:hypothetical protein